MVTAAAARSPTSSTIQGGGGAGATNNNNISKLPPAANAQEEGGKYYIHGQNRILRCKFTCRILILHPYGLKINSSPLSFFFRWWMVVVTSYNNLLEMRYSQLVEEQEHKFSTATNQKELLTQTLHRLRLLKDEIARDDWMFEGFGK